MRQLIKGVHMPSGDICDILVEDEHIAAISPDIVEVEDVQVIDGKGALLIPGMIDVHIHGAAGCDLMDGREESFQAVSRKLAETGCTGFLPTSVSSDLPSLFAFIDAAKAVYGREQGTCILGIHVEGPYLNPKRKGMQNVQHLRLPDLAEMGRILERAKGLVRMVTLAPELPGGLELIRFLTERGVIAAIAHSDADEEQACEAFRAGARHITHSFNAMPSIHHRAPGLMGAALDDPTVSVQAIVDGHHLSPSIVRMLYRIKGADHMILITDAMQAMGIGDGAYNFGGHPVEVRDGVARMSDGTLASSTLSMNLAIKNCVEMGIPLMDAVRMATGTPAKLLGLHDAGELQVGQPAVFVLLDSSFNVIRGQA